MVVIAALYAIEKLIAKEIRGARYSYVHRENGDVVKIKYVRIPKRFRFLSEAIIKRTEAAKARRLPKDLSVKLSLMEPTPFLDLYKVEIRIKERRIL